MAAPEAVDFLIKDHGDIDPPGGFRKEFAEDKPYKSLLQRNGGKTLEELLELFDWREDDSTWSQEYENKPSSDVNKLIQYRRRVTFLVGAWRELNEDFKRGDVSCLREIRTPLVTSRAPLKAMKHDFGSN